MNFVYEVKLQINNIYVDTILCSDLETAQDIADATLARAMEQLHNFTHQKFLDSASEWKSNDVGTMVRLVYNKDGDEWFCLGGCTITCKEVV